MKNIFRTISLTSAGLALTIIPLQAEVITFDQIPSPNNAIQTGTITTQGFNFTSSSFHIIDQPGLCAGGCVDEGSQYLAVIGPGLDAPVVVTNAAGQAFSVSGLDAAKLFLTPGGLDGYPNANTLDLSGTLSGGRTVSAYLTLPSEGSFSTLNLSGFTGLTSLTISGTGGGEADASWALDNLIVSSAGSSTPEPATMFLFLCAFFAGLVARRSRHSAKP